MSKLKLTQQLDVKGNISKSNQLMEIKVLNRRGKLQKIYMHAYLIGLAMGFKSRAMNKFSTNVIVIGSVGSGKSTLAKAIAGVRATIEGKKLDWQHLAWDTNTFVEEYHNEKEKGMPIIFDESIDGVGSLNVSNKGKQLKKALVTGRFMLRDAYFLTDELHEFTDKMIRSCKCLIRVRNFGFRRGYFEVYTNKRKIRFIYNGLKFFNKTWDSPDIKKIKPDCKGKFPDYSGVFFDEDEYDRRKLEDTKEKDDAANISWKPDKMKAYTLWIKGNSTNTQIALDIGVNRNTISTWVQEFKRVMPS